MAEPVIVAGAAEAQPWHRRLTRTQWNAFWAAFLGWLLDGFDFTIVTFLLIDIQRSFTVNKALAGALGTVTLFFRVVGGIGSGTAADRWGRKGPLMFSVLWYSVFASIGGFSTSYRMLFACRALFGIGMGGVWAAGMPLALEHWPPGLRGRASGLLQSGYSVGFILSSIVYQFVYPLVNQRADFGWRVMLWIGILPALLVWWIMTSVGESPVWLERQRHLRERHQRDTMSLARLFRRDLLAVTIHTSLVMGAFLFLYQAITFWYPTYLAQMHHQTLPFMLAFNIGAVMGAAACGRASESRLGRRGAAIGATTLAIVVTPLYLFTASSSLLGAGAWLMGFFGAGNFGMVPGYLTERFPTSTRGAGAGFAYHVGAGLGSLAPYQLGAMQDRGIPLASAMTLAIIVSGLLLIALMWMGPETRGRAFHAEDQAIG